MLAFGAAFNRARARRLVALLRRRPDLAKTWGMHVFGLTGGIASGKSSVARRFRERHVPVIDADELAREVVAFGSEGLRAVVEAFGKDVLLPDGSLDRGRLGDLVFSDASKRAILNGIVHPRIAAASATRISDLTARSEPVACYEAALLVENGLADAFRPLVVVAASPEVQAARIASRDGLDEARARARIAAQRPLDEKVRLADVVVRNDGSLKDLEREADRCLREVLRRLGVDLARYFGAENG